MNVNNIEEEIDGKPSNRKKRLPQKIRKSPKFKLETLKNKILKSNKLSNLTFTINVPNQFLYMLDLILTYKGKDHKFTLRVGEKSLSFQKLPETTEENKEVNSLVEYIRKIGQSFL